MIKKYIVLTSLLVAFGCQSDPPPSDQPPGTDSSLTSERAPWIGKVWSQKDTTDLPGKLRIFLANGTLVMDSCWETYQLANWEARSDSVVVWEEGTAEIKAHLKMIGENELSMRLILKEDTIAKRYQEAEVPYVCPDMKR
jgi:hypothetical protein